jgi:hypothetical protein
MLQQDASMMDAQQLVWAVEGLKVTPPAVLVNLVTGYELLSPTVMPAVVDPAAAIIAAAEDGKLTQKTLDDLLAKASTEAAANEYRQLFRTQAERKFLQRFYVALGDGAADEILDGLRPQFDTAAAELAAARAVVDMRATPERLLNVTATPEEQAAWRSLPDLIRTLDRIGAIAAAFGLYSQHFPLVEDPRQNDVSIDFRWCHDYALMATTGDLLKASAAFRAARPNWQASPWLRVTPKLATITEARERVRVEAEADFAAREASRAPTGSITDNGWVKEVRANPHLAEAAK